MFVSCVLGGVLHLLVLPLPSAVASVIRLLGRASLSHGPICEIWSCAYGNHHGTPAGRGCDADGGVH